MGQVRLETERGAWISLKVLHHSLQACVSRHRLFSFPRTESVLDSSIAAFISAVSRGQYTSHLLFCYDFPETTCVTSRIRHRGFSAQIRKSALCISFLAALRTIRTKAVFVFFHGLFEKKPLCELIFVIYPLKYAKLQKRNQNKDKRR